MVLDRRSPVLHVIQKIRDESHRFAVTYHRKRRQMRDRTSELDEIPGVGAVTRQRLLEQFGSLRALKQTAEKNPDALTAVVSKVTAEKIRKFFAQAIDPNLKEELIEISFGSYKVDGARTHDGRWKLVADSSATYRTRVLVREPADASKFSGGTGASEFLSGMQEAFWKAGSVYFECNIFLPSWIPAFLMSFGSCSCHG